MVYFPSGKYLVTAPIIRKCVPADKDLFIKVMSALYYTALVGDAKNRPTLVAAPTFEGMAVIGELEFLKNGVSIDAYTT